MAQSGPLAAFGKGALLSMRIWEEEINAKGGLIGRPVKLIYYDDQSDPAAVPASTPSCSTSTRSTSRSAAMHQPDRAGNAGDDPEEQDLPVAVRHGGEREVQVPEYFSMVRSGREGAAAFALPFFEVAKSLNPKPKTIALVGADAEYPHKALAGSRKAAQAAG